MSLSTGNVIQLNLGVNWRGFVGSVTMREGEAQDCLDMLPREDGGTYKTFGWRRINDTALTGVPIACKGFTYRGKNAETGGGDTARTGNFGLADDGADFTRRTDEFSTFIVLTSSTFYFWNHATQAFASVSLPGGVSVDPAKPTIQIFKNNAYIVGWASKNLRYDPTDRALYVWGWESAPNAPTVAAAAGGDLDVGTYKYAYAYFDIYTGEETTLGASSTVTTTSANATVNLTLSAYSGSRHFNTLAVATDSDVGIVIYRSGPNFDDNAEEFHFLTTLNPGTTSYSDTGDAVDTAIEPWRGTMEDEPRFSALHEFKGRFYALAQKSNSNRLYFSAFTNAPFVERYEVRNYRDLVVPEGDALKAIGSTDATLLIYTRKGVFRTTVIENLGAVAQPQIIPTRLPWDVGCVGPRGRLTIRGWEYFLSERGPYRWREGLTDPQWIGENVSPMFIDPLSPVCKLSESAMDLAELGFEWFSDTVRFIFAVGHATRPNIQLAYWIECDEKVGDYRQGWWPQSVQIQTMDQSSSIGGLDGDGRPPSGAKEKERLVFGDVDGFMYEYILEHRRGGLKEGALAKGLVASVSSNVLTVDGGLYTVGDGLKGLRLEVLSGSTVQIHTIVSNTDNTITVTNDFDPAPSDGDLYWVGGIPAYWRSWVDHMGDPQAHKSLMHVYWGFVRTGSKDSSSSATYDWLLDVSVGGGDFPESFQRTRTARLSEYRKKLLTSLTHRFFVYEAANSRPDELFALTNLQREFEPIGEKRLL